MPGKQYTTVVYYTLPRYYSTQVLSQMAANSCSRLSNLCYTDESSLFIIGGYGKQLWGDVWEFATELYGNGLKKRPTKSNPNSKIFRPRLNDFSNRSQFIVEFPSVKGVLCKCSEQSLPEANEFCKHLSESGSGSVLCHTDTCQVAVTTAKDELVEAYQLLRRPAKELLVGVKSDLEIIADPAQPDTPHRLCTILREIAFKWIMFVEYWAMHYQKWENMIWIPKL